MTSTDTRTPQIDPAQAARPVATTNQDGHPGVPLQRLINVELRKMVDTRAGWWMLVAMSAISLIVVTVLLIVARPDEKTYANFLGYTSLQLLLLLPILGIMAATAEWSQRTGLVTFTLEPRRGRVIVAKIVAAVILGLIVTASAGVVCAVANLIGGGVAGGDGTWDVTWAAAVGVIVGYAIFVLQGLAFGFAFLNTPFAIVASLLLPSLWSVATSLSKALAESGKWLDLTQSTGPLFDGTMTGENWGQLATSVGVWVLLPLAIGSYRVMHREVK